MIYSTGSLGQTTTGDDEWERLRQMSRSDRIDMCDIHINQGKLDSLACEYIVGNDVYSNIEELKRLCSAGIPSACRELENKLSPAELAEMARRRNEQAEAERKALAKKLRDTGRTAIADAVENQRDVQWKQPTFYDKNKYYVWGGAAVVALGAVLLLSRRAQ